MRNLYCLFAAVCIVFSSCYDDSDLFVTSDYNNIDEFMQAHCLPVQNFTFNAQTGGTFTGDEGLEITVPPNVLVNANGLPVLGTVDVELIEALDFDDMIFSKRSPTISRRAIQTYGQFMVRFSQNGNTLKLDSAQYYIVTMPRKETSTPIQYFLNLRHLNWYSSTFNSNCTNYADSSSWRERSNFILTPYGAHENGEYYIPNFYSINDTVFISPNDDEYVEMHVGATGWVNCGTSEKYLSKSTQFNTGTSGFKTFNISAFGNYEIKLGTYYQNTFVENTKIFLYAPGKIICPIYTHAGVSPQSFSYVTNYFNPPFKLVAFGIDTTGAMYYGQTDVNSVPGSGDIPLLINMTPSTETQILYNLEDLN